MPGTSQDRYAAVAQIRAAMDAPDGVVGGLWGVLGEPPVYAVAEGYPFGVTAGHLAVVFPDGGTFVVQCPPVGGVPDASAMVVIGCNLSRNRTDKTDRRAFVSFVSAPFPHIWLGRGVIGR